jgi:hypothetical protein
MCSEWLLHTVDRDRLNGAILNVTYRTASSSRSTHARAATNPDLEHF